MQYSLLGRSLWIQKGRRWVLPNSSWEPCFWWHCVRFRVSNRNAGLSSWWFSSVNKASEIPLQCSHSFSLQPLLCSWYEFCISSIRRYMLMVVAFFSRMKSFSGTGRLKSMHQTGYPGASIYTAQKICSSGNLRAKYSMTVKLTEWAFNTPTE